MNRFPAIFTLFVFVAAVLFCIPLPAAGIRVPDDHPTIQSAVDGSGRVDGGDFVIFARSWGFTAGQERYDPRADFDNSRTVDGEDLAVLASVFGRDVGS
jgi:hypothetical protein